MNWKDFIISLLLLALIPLLMIFGVEYILILIVAKILGQLAVTWQVLLGLHIASTVVVILVLKLFMFMMRKYK